MPTNNRQKFLLITAAVVIGLLIADSFIFEPLAKSWEARASRIKQLKSSLREGHTMVTAGPGLRDTWDRMRTNTLSTDLSQAESDFLKSIDRWAKTSGINLASTHPQWKQAGEDYSTLECSAEASGTLEGLAKFLYNAERAHSIHSDEKDHISVRIDSVKISSRDNDGQQLSFLLQLSGLQLISQTQ